MLGFLDGAQAGGEKIQTLEANSNPNSPPLEFARAASGHKLGNYLKQWLKWPAGCFACARAP